MREIKFRAWNIKDKEMIYDPSLLTDDWADTINEYFKYWSEIVEEDEKLIFMQYTGLKDKNNKEIYEGDIIGDEDVLGIIIWDNENARFTVKFNETGIDKSRLSLTDWLEHWKYRDYKIVGNIYENSELYKGE